MDKFLIGLEEATDSKRWLKENNSRMISGFWDQPPGWLLMPFSEIGKMGKEQVSA